MSTGGGDPRWLHGLQGILAVLQHSRGAGTEVLQELCGVLAMRLGEHSAGWLSRYSEVLETIPEKRWPSRSVEAGSLAVWTLLVKLDDSCAHDALVISAIAVLSSAAWRLSRCQEYIARDVEGNDLQTRRWAAIDLVRSLRRRHDKETCEARQRGAAEAMGTGGTGGGTGGLATEFFKEQLGPELLTVQEPPRGTALGVSSSEDAELVLGVLPRLPLLLQAPQDLPSELPNSSIGPKAEHPLLHSYAAICANVLTTVQDRVVSDQGAESHADTMECACGRSAWRPRYQRDMLGPVVIEMMPILLQLLVEELLGAAGPSLPDDLGCKTLKSLTQVACSTDHGGEAVGVSGSQPNPAPNLKGGGLAALLLSTPGPHAGDAWKNGPMGGGERLQWNTSRFPGNSSLGVAESIPLYAELLQQAPGKVPGLVRLLRAFFAKALRLGDVLALANKQSAGAAVGLLCAAFRFLPFELYCNQFQAMAVGTAQAPPQAALAACLSRLESIKVIELEKAQGWWWWCDPLRVEDWGPMADLVVALSIFVKMQPDGAAVLRMALNQQKEGLFEHFLMEAQ
eukprot:Skav211533  [mRNA]  locus=scaffold352:404086:421683:- [translate_table: standard]